MRIDGLDHVGLAVADRTAAERFFAETLGLERDGGGRFRVGKSAFELLDVAADAGATGRAREGIAHLGLRVANLEDAADEANRLGLPTRAGGDCALGPGGAVAHLDPAGTAGVRVCLVQRATADERSVPGADGLIERIDHIGVASADNTRARDVFAGLLGLVVESSQTDTEVRIPAEFFVSDKYGVVFKTRAAETVGGLRVLFSTVGDCELEILQDFDPSTAIERAAAQVGSTKRDQGAISRFVETRGPGLHHVALKVRDVDAMLRRLEAGGVTLIDRRGRPGSRRAQIAFLHPKSTHGVLFHLAEREEVAS